MIFERSTRKSRENSAVKYNPYKNKRKNISVGKSDINLLNSKKNKNERKISTGIFDMRRQSNASRNSSYRNPKRRKSKRKNFSKKNESQRKVTKSIERRKGLTGGLNKTSLTESEFFTSLKSCTNGVFDFKRKPSLDVQHLAEEKAKQNLFGRKTSLMSKNRSKKLFIFINFF